MTASDPLREASRVMHEIRERCVWSAGRDHRDLVPYLLEESYELAEALESGADSDVREELGDVLWQVLFHAEIAAGPTGEGFDIDEVARALIDKMVRRHPHVFAGATATTPEQVVVLWSAAKSAEKSRRRSILEGIPRALPSLARAQKILERAAGTGIAPLADADADAAEPLASESDLGERLLSLVEAARVRGWDAERALRERIRGVEDAVRDAERSAASEPGE